MSTALKIKENFIYTWKDYLNFPNDEHWEIIDGQAVMQASPRTKHQQLVGDFYSKLNDFFKDKKCELFLSPLDVKLSETDIFQPDLFVVCNPDIIKDTHIDGSPTLVIEILSPATASIDKIRKFHLYEKFGVKEYWIITPEPLIIEVYNLEKDKYQIHDTFGESNSTLTSANFADLKIEL